MLYVDMGRAQYVKDRRFYKKREFNTWKHIIALLPALKSFVVKIDAPTSQCSQVRSRTSNRVEDTQAVFQKLSEEVEGTGSKTRIEYEVLSFYKRRWEDCYQGYESE